MTTVERALEDHRAEIVERFRAQTPQGTDAALILALPLWLRTVSRGSSAPTAAARAMDEGAETRWLLVIRPAHDGAGGLVREWALVRSVVHAVLRRRGRLLDATARLRLDAAIDEAIAISVTREIERERPLAQARGTPSPKA